MKNKLDRREFVAIAAGVGASLMASRGNADRPAPDVRVPKSLFGRSGMKISRLCLGGFSVTGKDGSAVMDEAVRTGVDCWEITSFTGRIFGEYFKTHPGLREKVFLTGKVKSTDPVVMQEQLDKVLRENETTVLDFLAIHTVEDLNVLGPEVRRWVERAKKEQKIRLFGFCTHRNMDQCLTGAADLGWIDGVQTFYNYRMQGVPTMEAALRRCHEKGIGIFAVKSMGLGVRNESELDKLSPHRKKLGSVLAARGISFQQAKLKAVWGNRGVTSLCSLMPTPAIVRANASAAMDEHPLDVGIRRAMADYAAETGKYFCRRCGICETANTDQIPIFSIMEMLMYAHGYGFRDWAVKGFEQIPAEIRRKISSSDYSTAEAVCPQKIPIGRLMRDAYAEFVG